MNLLYTVLKPFVWTINLIIINLLPCKWIDVLYSYEITENLRIKKRITDFDKVVEFNTLFNVPQVTRCDFLVNNKMDSSKRYCKILLQGFDLIKEEYQELQTALQQNNKVEIKDALCDLAYVIYGLLYRLNECSNTKLYFQAKQYIEYLGVSTAINDIDNKLDFNKLIKSTSVKNTNIKRTSFDELNIEYAIVNYNIKLISDYIQHWSEYPLYTVNYKLYNSLVSLLVEVYLIGDELFDYETAFDIVHSSNMSKVCTSEDEARETVKTYQSRYEAGDVPYDSPYYERISSDKWMVRNRSTNKVLKNINYRPVEKYFRWNNDPYLMSNE